MADANIVKILRQKCDDLEDKLDEVVEAKDAALSSNSELHEELAKLTRELEAERESRLRVVDADDSTKVEKTQANVQHEQERQKVLEEGLREAALTTDALQEELSAAEAGLDDERKRIDRERDNLVTQRDSALEQTTEREAKLHSTKLALDEIKTKLTNLDQERTELAVDRDCALERVQTAEQEKQTLESRLATTEQDIASKLAALVEKTGTRVADLEAALAKEKQLTTDIRQSRDALESANATQEEKVLAAKASFESVQELWFKVEKEVHAAEAGSDELKTRVDDAHMELAREKRQDEELQQELVDLTSGTIEDSSRVKGDQRITELQQALVHEEEELNRALETYHGLEKRWNEHVEARDTEGERAQRLADELAAKQHLHATDRASSVQLQETHEELLREHSLAGERNNTLANQLQENHQSYTADAMSHDEVRSSSDRLNMVARSTSERVAKLVEDVESQRRQRTALKEAADGIKAKRDETDAEREACAIAAAEAQAEFDNARESHQSERARADELKGKLDNVMTEHENLFTQYSDAQEQIDILRNDTKKVQKERDGLRRTLDESRGEEDRARKEREDAEAALPTQLAVSDVLISVVFDGVPTPLEMKPWDTDVDGVVSNWLATASEQNQLSADLRPSLVKYLRMLEESAECFPVRTQAKLADVHDQFAS